MDKTLITRSPRAVTAIAAVLALSSTSAFAQEAAPTLTMPQNIDSGSAATSAVAPAETASAPASAPAIDVGTPASTVAAPTIVLPNVTAPEAPVMVQAPAPAQASAATEAQGAAEAGTQKAAPAARSRQASAPRENPTVPTAASSGTAADGALAAGPVPAPSVAPSVDPAPLASAEAVAAQPAPVADNESGDLGAAGIAGLLAALGIAGAGVFAMSRRRKKNVADTLYREEPDVTATANPEVHSVIPTTAASTSRAPVAPAVARPAGLTAGAMLAAGYVPTDPEERRELIEQMVAAEPDESNPFHTRKARRRRARMQLSAREAAAKQGDQFDWRTYRPSRLTAPQTPTSVREPVTV